MVSLEAFREVARACGCANLRRAARATTQFYDAALSPSGLRCTQFTLLVTSRLMGGASINDLAGQMDMDRTTLSRNLRPLVRDGLMDMLPGEDGRTRLARVTPAGRAALDRAYPMWQRAQEQIVDALGQDQFEGLLDELGRTVTISRLPSDPGPQAQQRT